MRLPLLLSVPHAGAAVPPEVAGLCTLAPRELVACADEAAAEVYWPLEDQVAAFVTTDVARVVVDVNQPLSEDPAGGPVRRTTPWGRPVYKEPLSAACVRRLLERYYRPYHRQLEELAATEVVLGVDCHTVARDGPAVLCLGGSPPRAWAEALREHLASAFAPCPVHVRAGPCGDHIARRHARRLPWVHLALPTAHWTHGKLRRRVLAALARWCTLAPLD